VDELARFLKADPVRLEGRCQVGRSFQDIDNVQASAVNFYEGVTQSEAEKYYGGTLEE